MKLYYNPSSNRWYHTENKDIFFGLDRSPLPIFPSPSKHHFMFEAGTEKNRIPVFGILTSRSKRKPAALSGNIQLFKNLHRHFADSGIFSFVITADDYHAGELFGFVYSDRQGKWVKTAVPVPDVLYNRIPFRSGESGPEYERVRQETAASGTFLFNPCFLNKLDLHMALGSDPFLMRLLPETAKLDTFSNLAQFFNKYTAVYLKPEKGNQGRGISVLRQGPGLSVTAEKTNSLKRYDSLQHFWEAESRALLHKGYIIQRAIEPLKLDGHRFDYRLLVHGTGSSYQVTGTAVRISKSQEVTTHIPRGGAHYPYEALRSSLLDSLLTETAIRCGRALTAHFGYFGEFSIDMGQDVKGDFYLYEVNAKPMEFDEADIEHARLEQLRKLFLELLQKKRSS